jgi:hypothetical protein
MMSAAWLQLTGQQLILTLLVLAPCYFWTAAAEEEGGDSSSCLCTEALGRRHRHLHRLPPPSAASSSSSSLKDYQSRQQPCVHRNVLSAEQSAAAASVLRSHLLAHPAQQLRGGSGADIATFDGGGGELRSMSSSSSPDNDSFVVFDAGDGAHSAVSTLLGGVGARWPRALRGMYTRLQPPGKKVGKRSRRRRSGEAEAAVEASWPILSVGGGVQILQGSNDTGLPPHVHGASHLLLLRGSKEWALWSPENGMPEGARQHLPPPLLRGNASAVLARLRALRTTGEGRPLFCVQKPGDVMSLPAGTYHATRNIGATLAIGGQSTWSQKARLRLADDWLERSDGTAIAAHVLAGTALVHQASAPLHSSAAEAQVMEWHLTRALRAEPTNARVAIALGDALQLVPGGLSKATRVVTATAEALSALVRV